MRVRRGRFCPPAGDVEAGVHWGQSTRSVFFKHHGLSTCLRSEKMASKAYALSCLIKTFYCKEYSVFTESISRLKSLHLQARNNQVEGLSAVYSTSLLLALKVSFSVPHPWHPPCFSLLFSCSVVSVSLQLHGLQHARLPCPSPSPRARSNSCPLSQWCHPTISPSVIPSSSCPVFPSIRVFSNESALHIRWPKYGSFSFSISPSSEYSGLLSSRIDWFNLLAVQGTLKSLLQHHSSKTSILRAQAFFFFNLPFQPRCFLSLRASAYEM